MSANQPLTDEQLAEKYSQSSQTKQTHDKHLLSLLHLKSPHLNGRKDNYSHVLYDSNYCAHAAGVGLSDAISRFDILVPGVLNRAAGEYGEELHANARNADEAHDCPCRCLEAVGWENAKVKQNDGNLDQGHKNRKDCCRDEQGLKDVKDLPVLEIPHVLAQPAI